MRHKRKPLSMEPKKLSPPEISPVIDDIRKRLNAELSELIESSVKRLTAVGLSKEDAIKAIGEIGHLIGEGNMCVRGILETVKETVKEKVKDRVK